MLEHLVKTQLCGLDSFSLREANFCEGKEIANLDVLWLCEVLAKAVLRGPPLTCSSEALHWFWQDGDLVYVTQEVDEEACLGVCKDCYGKFPKSILKPLTAEEVNHHRDIVCDNQLAYS